MYSKDTAPSNEEQQSRDEEEKEEGWVQGSVRGPPIRQAPRCLSYSQVSSLITFWVLLEPFPGQREVSLIVHVRPRMICPLVNDSEKDFSRCCCCKALWCPLVYIKLMAINDIFTIHQTPPNIQYKVCTAALLILLLYFFFPPPSSFHTHIHEITSLERIWN